MNSVRSALLGILILGYSVGHSQPWMADVKSENPTIGEINTAFDNYWKGKTVGKGAGYKPFKRWEWFWESRVGLDKPRPNPMILWNEWQNYKQAHPTNTARGTSAANWTFQGPFTSSGGYRGIGRINTIAFHPTDPLTFWVGTAGGGLWKTTTGGTTWTTTTNDFPVLGVSGVAIDNTNPDIIYVATGDGDAQDTYSVGVMKSIDGGLTWNPTGLNWSVTSYRSINRLVIDPSNTQVLFAATSSGIYRTTDGGTNWSLVSTSSNFKDLELKPGDSQTIYASTSSGSIYRSTNGGSSFSLVQTLSGAYRVGLAVSPADPNLVQAIAANSSDGLAGLWKSTNSGASFTQYIVGSSTKNFLNSSYSGSGTGGQGWYDLALAINPTNANDVWLGGVNTWRTTDGGTNWSIKTMWTGGNPVPTVHADKHFQAFNPADNALYECNDGGVYRTTDNGTTWTDLTNGLGISQIYKLSVSASTADNVLIGLQDNGSRQINNNFWYERTGGDGMECIIDNTNPTTMYTTYVYGQIYKTTNNFGSYNTIVNYSGTGVNAQGNWVTPYVMNPLNNTILLVGKSQLYKSTDAGSSGYWKTLGYVSGSGNINAIAYAPSDTNTIYVAKSSTLSRTTNGGTNWTIIGSGKFGPGVSYVAVSNTDANKIWVTLSGYTSGQKVYYSTDGGATFTNISGTLPNVPVNCVVHENNPNDGVYIGTDLGVYYMNSSMTDWIRYSDGLPNVVVNELEISYTNNKLWAATYGRGLWNSDLYTELPLSLLSFKARPVQKTVVLNWRTASEKDTKEFIIERSLDGSTWSSIGAVKAKNVTGENSYEYRDMEPLNGRSYYRLKMMDIDGKFTYSPVADVDLGGNAQPFVSIAPNPATSSTTVYFKRTTGTAEISVYDEQGRKVIAKSLKGDVGTSYMMDISKLTAGFYRVIVKVDAGIFTENLIKGK